MCVSLSVALCGSSCDADAVASTVSTHITASPCPASDTVTVSVKLQAFTGVHDTIATGTPNAPRVGRTDEEWWGLEDSNVTQADWRGK